jgi:hypothetical protein
LLTETGERANNQNEPKVIGATSGGEKSGARGVAKSKSNPPKVDRYPKLTKREKKERCFEIMELEWAKNHDETWPRAERREDWDSMTPEMRKWFVNKNP